MSQPSVASPGAFFVLAALLILPFPVAAHFVHVPGMPKNIPVTDFAAAFVPAAAALVLTWRAEGAAGARRLLRRAVDRGNGKPVWFVIAVLLPLLSLVATGVLLALTGLAFPEQAAVPAATLLLFVVVFLAAAAGEELGWSGYAIEPLQRRWGALGGSVVLGAVWGAFHISSILQSGQGSSIVLLAMVGAVATRVLWVWLFNNTGGSVLAVVVVHAVSNLCGASIPEIPTAANTPVMVLLAVLVTVFWGPRTLARFRVPGAAADRS